MSTLKACKPGILILIMLLVVAMAVPAMASKITGTKTTEPATPNMYYVGDTIYYTMSVSNPADNTETNTLTRVWDTLPDGTVVELIAGPLVQAPGDVATFSLSYVVRAEDIVTLPIGKPGVRNVFQAEGYDTADDDVQVLVTRNSRIIQPCLDIEKTVDFDGDGLFDDCETGSYNGTATWKIVVTNCGTSDLTGVVVYDSNGMSWDPFNLLVGQSWEASYTEINIVAPKTNTATASGIDELGGPVGPVSDDACVDVEINPCIAIEKTVDFDGDGMYSDCESGPYNGTAMWKIVVTNCGDSPLNGIMVTDTNGMSWGPFSLGIGEAWVETYEEYELVADKTNTAMAQGYDVFGGPVGPVSDDACVDVEINPCIVIEKTVDFDGDGMYSDCESGPYNGTAMWKIVVTNCGDSPLNGIMVTDTNGMSWGPFNLEIGEQWATTYEEYNLVADKTNTATAQGYDVFGGPVGPVSDDACVYVIPEEKCYYDETAWGYGGGYAKPNWNYVNNRFWGWTNGPLGEGSYSFDLYAAAGQNDLSKGMLVGKVYVNYSDGYATVSYETSPGYYLGEVHLWVGNDVLPKDRRGRYTNAPGQFPYQGYYNFEAGEMVIEWTSDPVAMNGSIYVAAHAVVWIPMECSE